MNDDELERRIERLFAEVSAPDGVRRFEAESIGSRGATGEARSGLLRLPPLRRASGRWAPLTLVAAISIVVGIAGLVAGGLRLAGGGTSGQGAAGSAAQPAGRLDPALAYDPAMHAVVMFGGRNAQGQALDDTWAWDGQSWKQLQPATKPPARSGAGMAWDSASGRLVLAGGMGSIELGVTSASSSCTTSVESHGGVSGISVACSGSASAGGAGFAIACPTNASKCPGVVVSPPGLVPAQKPAVLKDTWTWDGNDWHAEHPAHTPPTAASAQMVSDPAGGTVMAGAGLNAIPAIACPVPAVVPNSTPNPAPPCPRSTLPVTSTSVARWDGHDWSSLPSIPTYNARLAVVGGNVVAVTSAFSYCGPPLEVASGDTGGADIACRLGDGTVGAAGSSGTVTATSTSTATGGNAVRVPIGKPPAPAPVPVPAAALYSYVLRGGAWVAQTMDRGPSYPQAVSTFRGSLLALDGAGRTWTGDGRTWHDAGPGPFAYVYAGTRMAEDTDRHVTVLVAGYPTSSLLTAEWDGSAWHLRSGTPPTPSAVSPQPCPLAAGQPSDNAICPPLPTAPSASASTITPVPTAVSPAPSASGRGLNSPPSGHSHGGPCAAGTPAFPGVHSTPATFSVPATPASFTPQPTPTTFTPQPTPARFNSPPTPSC